jgi:gliding motility-associated-like protein
VTNDGLAVYPVGTTTVTWTVTDIHGNVNTCTQVVTVTDNELPTIACPSDVTITADAGLCSSSVVVLGTPVTADNCGVATVTNDGLAVYPVGTTTVTWTVTDIHGNVNTCTQVVTVTDNELPTIACPSDVTITADAGLCSSSVVVLGTPVTADNCGVASVTNNAPSTFPVGTTIVTWTVTDNSGNTASCDQTVTVTDNELPTIACPADITITADAGLCTASSVALGTPATADNCGVATVTNDGLAVYPVGTTTVTWTVTDIHGNVNTCTQVVTVTDNELPTITCPSDVTITADAGLCSSSVVVLGTPVTTDNCGVATVTNDGLAVYPVGTTTVTWTVTDIHGNVNTCTQVVTVTDNELPTIACPSDVTITADAGLCSSSVVVLGTPVTADNCGVATVTNDGLAVYPVGTTTVTWTVTDIHGNVNTCTQVVTVTDNELPTIVCPSDVTITADAGLCSSSVVVLGTPVTADNCGVATVTNDGLAVYPVGSTTVTWTVTDIHGNVNTCTQVVTVTDDELPVIACQELVSVSTDLGSCDASVLVPIPSTTDNCGIATVLNSFNGTADASGTYPQGSTIVVWTITDIHGNTNTCSTEVVVSDTELPSVACLANVYDNSDFGLCAGDVQIAIPVFDDNCSVTSIVNDFTGTQNASGVYPVGITSVTWTVTDASGNEAQCIMNVHVSDIEIPVVNCAADTTINSDSALCGAYFNAPVPSATDNCTVALVVNDYTGTEDASATYPVGTTVVNWTATDIYGNMSGCSTSITVVDIEAPQVACPADIEVPASVGACNAYVEVELPIATDNCSVATITNDYTSTDNASSIYPVGITEILWTVADSAGNSIQCTSQVVVVDLEAPVFFDCPADVTVVNDAGVCGANVVVGLPEAADNCTILSVLNSFNADVDASGLYPVGSTVVTWSAIDAYGNISTCETTVIVTDTELPIIICPDTLVVQSELNQCGAVVNYNLPVVTDNCAIAESNLVSGPASGEFFDIGTTDVIYQFVDASGNASTCTFQVRVEDVQFATVICTDDIVATNLLDSCGAFVNFNAPQYFDNCGAATVTQIEGPESGSYFETGVTVITYQIEEQSGNVQTCSFTVTVLDAQNPEIQCNDDITQIDPIVNFQVPNATDNCGATVSQIDGPGTGEPFPHGYTTVTFVAIDIAENTDTCSFQVLINTPPVAVNDSTDFYEDGTTISIDVLNNDFDLDGDSISVTSASANHGVVTINADGTLNYSVDPNEFCGQDTIVYSICDQYSMCDTAIVVVNVECFIDLYIPEGFSPNGDGVNDTFTILGLEDYPNNQLTVFNRWGHKVFEAKNYQNNWDGRSEAALTIGDDLLPKGTYYYVLDIGEKKPIKGFLYLNY